MIKLDRDYTIFNPKTSDKGEHGYTFFSISDSKKDANGNWENNGWYNIVTNGQYVLQAKDKVQLERITSIERTEYNGKIGYTIFADIRTNAKEVGVNEVSSVAETLQTVTDEEVPF